MWWGWDLKTVSIVMIRPTLTHTSDWNPLFVACKEKNNNIFFFLATFRELII